MDTSDVVQRVRERSGRLAFAVAAAVLIALGIHAGPPSWAAAPGTDDPAATWLLAWEAPQIAQTDQAGNAFTLSAFHTPTVREQTIRQVVVPAVDGGAVRLRLSNGQGRSTVSLGRVTVSRLASPVGPAIVPGSTLEAHFGGNPSLLLSPGEDAVSDPVAMDVARGDRLAVDIYVDYASSPYSGHSMNSEVSWVSLPGSGDQTGDVTGAPLTIAGNATEWVHSVDVLGAPRPVVVVLGDSTSDGYVPGVHYEWPIRLADRLGTTAAVVEGAVVANNLVHSKVCPECNPSIADRLDHDALSLPGVTDIIVFAGTNDITQLTPVAELERGLTDIARRARAHGVRAIVSTLIPRQDWYQYYKPEVMSPMRHELNDWIRANDAFDATVDFDAAIRDPLDPDRIWPLYDSGDRMHPGVLGMQKLADTVPIDVLVAGSRASHTG